MAVNKKKKLVNAVVSGTKRMFEGTLKVKVSKHVEVPKYKKIIKIEKNYLVGCNKNKAYSIGEKVFIEQVAPISKKKTWRIHE